jgi:hypothetical protein
MQRRAAARSDRETDEGYIHKAFTTYQHAIHQPEHFTYFMIETHLVSEKVCAHIDPPDRIIPAEQFCNPLHLPFLLLSLILDTLNAPSPTGLHI